MSDKLDEIAYLQQSEAAYQQEKRAHAQTRRDLDAKDHQHAEDRAEIERLRAIVEHLRDAAEHYEVERQRAEAAEAKFAELIAALMPQAESNDLDQEVYEVLVKCGVAKLEDGYFVMKASEQKP